MRKTVVMAMFLIAYLVSSLLQSDFWGNILSPLSAFIAMGILCFSYIKTDHTIKVSITFLLYVFACASWFIADILWAVISFSGGVPDENSIVMAFYTITNCFLLVSMIVFAIYQFSKWDLVQSIIDLVISGLLTVVIFWILFLHKDMSALKSLFVSEYTSVLSISTDILICISIFSWFLSVRSGKIPTFMRIISFGLVLFAFVDMIYYYIDYHGLYIPNTLIDFMYIFSLSIIAFGALWKTYKNTSVFDLTVVRNTGGRKRWAYLLLYPFFTAFLSVTGIVDVRLNIIDYLTYAILIFLYGCSCKYVRLSLEKEALLRCQNEMLKQRIAEQVSELTFLANQDTLTTLFNRRYFMSCLDETIASVCPTDTLAILLMDLDRFKTINDTYGHDVGDKVLIDLSFRMIEWNNYGATIARLGGDEFAIMFSGKYTQRDIESFCIQIIDLCSKSITIENNSLKLTMSVGIAFISKDVSDGKTLMKQADISMYSAKAQGYNKYQVYNRIIDQDFKKSVEIESLLKQVDVEKDFKLFYQPQYSLPEKKLTGAEALLRWENKELGYIPPNVFIPIAEEIEYIYKIGKWVMQESIRQSIIWNERYSLPLKVGFNISPKQFIDKGFIQLLKTLISANNLNPAWIDAEITESVMINDESFVDDVFTLLKKIGVSVSIDDFGAGYSTLSYLNKFSFDRIKLDKSLIDNISIYNASGVSIAKAAIDMAHATGIKTIAEGVESKEQLDILIELGCDQAQGYLLGRPVPADVFEQRYIKKHIEY